MAEYIERDKIADKAVYMHGFGPNKYVPLSVIEKAPAADVAPVVHGRWETDTDPEFISKDFSCSVCEELLCDFDTTCLVPGENCYYYCPNCGARMDGE